MWVKRWGEDGESKCCRRRYGGKSERKGKWIKHEWINKGAGRQTCLNKKVNEWFKECRERKKNLRQNDWFHQKFFFLFLQENVKQWRVNGCLFSILKSFYVLKKIWKICKVKTKEVVFKRNSCMRRIEVDLLVWLVLKRTTWVWWGQINKLILFFSNQ